MKELDALMLRYLDNHYVDAPVEDKDAFEAILAMSDPELIAYFLKGETPAEEAQQRVVRRILG